MNEEEKRRYKERYKEKKADGEMFFPDTIAKDAVVSLGIFLLLILLVILLGVPSDPPANPSDSSYIPRPEWYFLWAFQLLKYFPGQIEGLAIVGLGLVIFLGLFGLPFFDRSPKRHPRNRPIATVVMLLIVAGRVFLTIQAVLTTPPQAEAVNVGGDLAARIEAGGKLYQECCAERPSLLRTRLTMAPVQEGSNLEGVGRSGRTWDVALYTSLSTASPAKGKGMLAEGVCPFR